MREHVIALLEDGAHTADELAVWLNVDKLSAIRALRALQVEGLTAKVERPDGAPRWSLIGPVPATPPRPVRKPKPLRQAPARPAKVTVTPEAQSSWWVGVSREDFAAKLGEQLARMAGTKTAKWVDGQHREFA